MSLSERRALDAAQMALTGGFWRLSGQFGRRITAVLGGVVSKILALLLKLPVFIHVPVDGQRAHLQNSFCVTGTLLCAGDVYAIFHKVTASTFDDAGDYGHASDEVSVVVQKLFVAEQVVGALIRVLLFN